MIATAIRAVCGLTRLDTCALVFFSVFLPVYYSTQDLYFSVTNALPVLTISMCGFVINDLTDIDKDLINHPNRPLPSNLVTDVTASLLYFSLLTLSLTMIKIYVDLSRVYLYVLLLIGLINYNYVVRYVPVAKVIYVAGVSIIPLLILSSLINNRWSVRVVVLSLFLSVLGREILMDIEDVAGDERTLPKVLGSTLTENTALAMRFIGSLNLMFVSRGPVGAAILVTLLASDAAFTCLWKAHWYRRPIIHLMKLQLLFGIYYLI